WRCEQNATPLPSQQVEAYASDVADKISKINNALQLIDVFRGYYTGYATSDVVAL
ncbi:hypothetical protein EVA_18084, partial [gut metagenome]